MPATVVEKILARCAGVDVTRSGGPVSVQPDVMLAYEMPGFTDRLFERMREQFGITKLDDAQRRVLFIDHLGSMTGTGL